MKKIISLGAIATAMIFLSGCGQTASNQTNPAMTPPQMQSQSPTSNAPSATQGSETNIVSIQNFAFDPGTLTIKKGTTVTWTNNDSAVHQIKSATFNSAALSKGQSFSFTFNDTGTFDYSCAIHPSMMGKIIVQ